MAGSSWQSLSMRFAGPRTTSWFIVYELTSQFDSGCSFGHELTWTAFFLFMPNSSQVKPKTMVCHKWGKASFLSNKKEVGEEGKHTDLKYLYPFFLHSRGNHFTCNSSTSRREDLTGQTINRCTIKIIVQSLWSIQHHASGDTARLL